MKVADLTLDPAKAWELLHDLRDLPPEVDPADRNQQQQLADWLLATNDFLTVRVLEDGSIAALANLIYTTSLQLGVNRWGWERRYCYPKASQLAYQAFDALKTEDDEPLPGWIDKRPE